MSLASIRHSCFSFKRVVHERRRARAYHLHTLFTLARRGWTEFSRLMMVFFVCLPGIIGQGTADNGKREKTAVVTAMRRVLCEDVARRLLFPPLSPSLRLITSCSNFCLNSAPSCFNPELLLLVWMWVYECITAWHSSEGGGPLVPFA